MSFSGKSEGNCSPPQQAKRITGPSVFILILVVIVGIAVCLVRFRPDTSSGAVRSSPERQYKVPSALSTPSAPSVLQEQALQAQALREQQGHQAEAQRARAAQEQRIRTAYEQQRQEIVKITESELNTLNRQYDIEYKALRRCFDPLEATEENRRRAANAVIQLNAKYALAVERIRSKRDLDLQLLESRMQIELLSVW